MNKRILSFWVLLIVFVPAFAQVNVNITVNGNSAGFQLSPVWGDHYDLSITHLNYPADSGFAGQMEKLSPRSWRVSVGRWEIATPAPAYGASTDTNLLKTVNREFYHGGNDLFSADNPSNYNFTYLDTMLSEILKTGAEPFLCFDYMPFTLSSVRATGTVFDLSGNPFYTFSNGIRTAKPSNPLVYARVVRNTVLHIRGLFAGTRDFGIKYIEIGNEPDLPQPYFWTSGASDFFNMYQAVANEVNLTTSVSSLIKLGCGSFAFFDTVFAASVLRSIKTAGTRIDFLSYHSYSDSETDHYLKMLEIADLRNRYAGGKELVNAEWGRALNGTDPVYDRIEHGLFRARVMILMQISGIKIAHESLFLAAGNNELGLLYHSPVGSKPASDVYRGFNLMSDCLDAVTISAPPGEFMVAGKTGNGQKVCIVYVGDSLPSGITKNINLQLSNFPWGNQNYFFRRYVVSQETWLAGQGVFLENSGSGVTGILNDNVTWGPGPGKGRLMIWEISSSPLSSAKPHLIEDEPAVWPNPANGIINISPGAELSEDFNFYLYDLTGRLVLANEFYGRVIHQMNLKGNGNSLLKPGSYIYEIRLGNGKQFKGKLMIDS